MKVRVDGVIVLFLSMPLSIGAQDTSGRPTNPAVAHSLVFNDAVKVIGPNGAAGRGAPTVLQVRGGRGGDGNLNSVNGGAGSGILLAGGDGGGSSQDAGSGGSLTFAAGSGGQSSEVGGSGGSITLRPGRARCGVICGAPGNVILALPFGGAVGIGTTSPTNTLEVATGGTTLADAWTTRSSRRLKSNIQPLERALEKVEKLQGVSYERKADGKREIGVVAEDVDEIVPEVVSRDPKTHEVQGVDYSRLAALLIEAVKAQQTEIRQLKVEIEELTSHQPRQY
jgi:hypothetical protein